MPDKGWKAFERRVANAMGGRRIPVTGERGGADVVGGGPFVYQCKLRRGIPTYLAEWLAGIRGAAARAGNDTIGVVIWKAPRKRDEDAVVILRYKDWQDLHGE